jgi:hypothetical protein
MKSFAQYIGDKQPFCIINSGVGIYVGEWIADFIEGEKDNCLNYASLKECILDCLNGPDDENYIESWIELSDNAEFCFEDNGEHWQFYENDGDVWMVPDSFDMETFFE